MVATLPKKTTSDAIRCGIIRYGIEFSLRQLPISQHYHILIIIHMNIIQLSIFPFNQNNVDTIKTVKIK